MSSERRTWRASRRRWLALAVLLAAAGYLVAINGAVALHDASEASAANDDGGTVSDFSYLPALRASPWGREVRIWRWRPLRLLAANLAGPVRVGLQVGHLDAEKQPDELAALRASTGGHWDGVDEVDMNLLVAGELATMLERSGIVVDLLPATVPPAYQADLLLSLHFDASPNEERNGYKSAHYRPQRNPNEPLLKLLVDRAMLATGLADDDRNVSGNMLNYYAFNQRHYRHAVARTTPALLVELGYLSNERDRSLAAEPELLAEALRSGILAYLAAIGRTP